MQERFESYESQFFGFKYNFNSFCKSFFTGFDNHHYLLTLNDISNESALICDRGKNFGNDLNLPNEFYGENDKEFLEKSDLQENLNEDGNKATMINSRLKGKFVSKNAANLKLNLKQMSECQFVIFNP